MIYWNILKKTALLGTDKMPLQTDFLPKSIQQILEKTDKNDAESIFLKASTLLFTYTKAGESLQKITLPDLALNEVETQVFCPNEATVTLKKIIDSEPFNVYLFQYFLEKCIDKQWVMPESMLLPLLNTATKKNLYKVHQVLGVRGKWLTQFNENWQLPTPKSYENVWQEGKPADRKEYFAQLRKEKPNETLLLLQQSWESESAKDRKDLLAILEDQLSAEDELFLNEKYTELTANQTTLKPVSLETVQLINKLRLKIPNSEFGKSIFEQIKLRIEKKKNLLSAIGLGGNWQLNLPKEEILFWNGTEMNQTFGFDKLSSQKGISDAEYWFSELLKILNPNHWLQFFEHDVKKMVNFFADSENSRKTNKPAYRNALSIAMQMANPIEIETFLKEISTTSIFPIDLIKQLDTVSQESLIPQYLTLNLEMIKQLSSLNIEIEWSKPFSEFILKNLLTEMQGGNFYYLYSDKDFILRLSKKLAIQTQQFIPTLENELSDEQRKNYWNTHFVDPILKQLELKEQIEYIN